jgi:spore germination protein YaaH
MACTSGPGPNDEVETGAFVFIGETPQVPVPLPEPEYPEIPPEFDSLPVSSFGEIWGYLLRGQEGALDRAPPLSDIGYFGAEVDSYGRLTGVPDPLKIRSFPYRIHMVVTCGSRGLAHFVMEPGSRARERLITDLLDAAGPFDGLQIDFELIARDDGEAFRSFLEEIRAGLGEKRFTIALPARTGKLENDVYEYQKILPLVDRILVMAYDEHWATSEPGPIASVDWCRSVAAYALSAIGSEKLIMGLPFYGRTWGNVNPNRAFFHSGIERIKRENNVDGIIRSDGIPMFTYEVPVTITVFYEDEYSLSTRLDMYRNMGVQSVGFWALGQETPLIWELLRLEK